MCDHAEKWCGNAHGYFLLLGQYIGWERDAEMGQQDHVLYRHSVWPCYLTLTLFLRLSGYGRIDAMFS